MLIFFCAIYEINVGKYGRAIQAADGNIMMLRIDSICSPDN